MSLRRVILVGGSGFVGAELVARLSHQVAEVVVLSRHRQRVRGFRVLPNVRVVETAVHDEAALADAFAGSDAVVNLVGILNESGSSAENTFEGAHVALTDKVLGACRRADVRRYLHMSALCADAEHAPSDYLRTKGEAERHVRAFEDGPAWTIFRPSTIFGPRDSFFNRFADLLRMLPVFPLACADAKMAPVYVGDVCEAFVGALDKPDTIGRSVDLCGPERYTLKELVEFTADTTGLHRRIVVLPDRLARLQARVMEYAPGKPFSMDNYRSLQVDNVCPDGCPTQPTSIRAVVPRYLGDQDVRGRLQSRRRHARR